MKLKSLIEEKEVYKKYKLLKQYPGMDEPVGTTFTKYSKGESFMTEKGHGSTEWQEKYFDKWVGKFFKEIK